MYSLSSMKRYKANALEVPCSFLKFVDQVQTKTLEANDPRHSYLLLCKIP